MSTGTEKSLEDLEIDDVTDTDTDESEDEPDAIMEEIGDVSLRVEGKDIKVSKSVLSIASPVFRAMFGSNFKEKDQTIIDIRDRDYDDVRAFLVCINPHILQEVTATNVYDILPLVDEYQVESLRRKSHDFLITQVDETSSPSHVLRHLHLAETYNLQAELKTRCCFMASEFEVRKIEECEKEYEISAENKLRVRNLALARYDIQKADDAYVKEIMESQAPKSFLKVFREGFWRKNDAIFGYYNRQPATNQNTRTAAAYGAYNNEPYSTAYGNGHRTTDDDFRMIRIVYRYFAGDKELTGPCVKRIQTIMHKLSAEDQLVFDLLPEKVKRVIRKKKRTNHSCD